MSDINRVRSGRFMVAVLVVLGGITGGVIGSMLGDSPLQSLLLAAVFGFVSYIALLAIALTVLYMMLRVIERAHDDK